MTDTHVAVAPRFFHPSFGRMGKTAECMAMAAQRSCNIVSMSFGLPAIAAGNYPKKDGRAQLAVLREADIITVAAASNDGSSSGGSSLFTTGASPGSLPGVLSVAAVESTAQPGSLLQLDREINTKAGLRNILGEHLQMHAGIASWDEVAHVWGRCCSWTER